MGYGDPNIQDLSDERLIDELRLRAEMRATLVCRHCGGRLGMAPGCANNAQHTALRISEAQLAKANKALDDLTVALRVK